MEKQIKVTKKSAIMKSTMLKNSQKTKLLEMCDKNLEAKNRTWYYNENLGYIYLTKNKKYAIKEFHWFEFCALHLADKIYEKLTIEVYGKNTHVNPWGNNMRKDFMYNCFSFTRNTHPVDYLYNVFKRLEK